VSAVEARGFGVYVHFPYCRKRCPYCDFATHARQSIPHERYARTVLAELEARAPLFAGRQAVSLYFGGGTPGLWRVESLARVLVALARRFASESRLEQLEITVECNPGELPLEQLEALRRAGVNRLSLGVQSLEPQHLVTLGRLHGAREPRQAVADARRAGFDNLSLDLMFGLPGQTLDELRRDLEGLLSLGPEHLSIYNLTIEPRTPFGALQRQGQLTVPDAEVAAAMYDLVRSTMQAHGFEHYEISNYARPGRRAVHNSLYWSGGEYLGLGSSAHSLRLRDDGVAERFASVRSVDEWFEAVPRLDPTRALEAGDPALTLYEELSVDVQEREALWLGLRLRDGIDCAAHARRFGGDPRQRYASTWERLRGDGLIEERDGRLRLTDSGLLFADEVGARLM
jgi:oxygen-independent coproporphyrinogen-3 oxidase